MIMLKNPSDQNATLKLKAEFQRELTHGENIKVYNYFDTTGTNEQVTAILDGIFMVIIAITMFLCFFSLSSSMSANLLDQTKEIGVLRALGFTKRTIKVVYFYEALILVTASCSLGVLIGAIVGYTLVAQQAAFTGIPMQFYFPWIQFYVIMALCYLSILLKSMPTSP